jgi:hypothetical protein
VPPASRSFRNFPMAFSASVAALNVPTPLTNPCAIPSHMSRQEKTRGSPCPFMGGSGWTQPGLWTTVLAGSGKFMRRIKSWKRG